MDSLRYTSTCDVSVLEGVATISIMPMRLWQERSGITPDASPHLEAWYDLHTDLARAIVEVRERADVRVVVITGAQEGTFGCNPTDPSEISYYAPPRDSEGTLASPSFALGHMSRTFTGVNKQHEAMVQCEKPIIAKVNGHAFGNSLAIMLACDIIVARDDAIMVDYHMGIDNWPIQFAPDISSFVESSPINGLVPGDGGIAWIPLYMSPALAKEFLMLGRPYTAKDFERMGIINHAVPNDQVDSLVQDLIQRLLSRPPEALAMTKRLANRSAVQHLNLTLDAASYAEWLSIALKALPRLR